MKKLVCCWRLLSNCGFAGMDFSYIPIIKLSLCYIFCVANAIVLVAVGAFLSLEV